MLLIFIKVVYIFIHLLIGVYDFSFYRIPNLLLAVLLILYGFYAPLYIGFDGILTALLVFATVLIIGLALFASKIIGGGDAKYLALISLWAGFPGVVQVMFLIAVVGGLMAIVYLLLSNYVVRMSDWAWKQIQQVESYCPSFQYMWLGSGEGPERGKRENISTRVVPYGVAIATGAIIMTLLHHGTL